jgi:LAO/AO transport system kinase
LYPHTGRAQVWGITGPPGAGKSTLVDQVTRELRAQGKRVAILAIDPSSPFTGGAVLGDRIRMQRHFGDAGVYIRSLGTRGKHGGLSHSTKECVLTLDAAGFDVILVETAGVGQTELDILRLAQSILVILVPESGDSIQVMKAGLMEIADVFVLNKSDRAGADALLRELITLIGMTHPTGPISWSVPVIKTEATVGKGIPEVVQQVANHQTYLKDSGRNHEKAQEFLMSEVEDILSEQLHRSVQLAFQTSSGQDLLQQLLTRKINPYEAARILMH